MVARRYRTSVSESMQIDKVFTDACRAVWSGLLIRGFCRTQRCRRCSGSLLESIEWTRCCRFELLKSMTLVRLRLHQLLLDVHVVFEVARLLSLSWVAD